MNLINKPTQKSPYFLHLLGGFTAFCFVMGFNRYYFDNSSWGTQSIFNIFLWIAAFYFFRLFHERKYSFSPLNMCFSGFITLVLFLGRYVYFHTDFEELFPFPKDVVFFIISLYGFIVFFYVVITFAMEKLLLLEGKLAPKESTLMKYLPVMGILIFLAWIPCYLAYYPGVFYYDMYDQTPQALGLVPVSRYHPPLHTWFWKLCLTLGSNGNAALVIYSVTQMLLLAAAFTYVLYFMLKKKMHPFIIIASFLFFSLNPVIAIFSFTPTKDVFFAIAFLVFTVELSFFVSDMSQYTGRIGSNLRIILSAVFCCLLRNNMVYALIPAMLIMLFVARKYWKNILLWACCIFLGYGLVNGPLYDSLGVEKGNSREMLSVPIQQIAYVVAEHPEELSDSDYAAINRYLPAEQLSDLYNPRLADPVKITFNTSYFEQNSSEFFKLWGNLLLRYPDDFLFSFLNLNISYWFPDANSYDQYATRRYIETYIYDIPECVIVRESKLPRLFNVYEYVASYRLFMNIPILSTISSIGMPIWVLLVGCLVLLNKKRGTCIIPLLPAVFYWCTFLLGPVSILRYVIPIIFLYPLYLSIIIQSSVTEKRDK